MLAAAAVSVAKPSFISLIFPKLFITFPKHSTWLLFNYGAIKDKTSPLKRISYNRRIPKRVLTLTSTYIFHSQFLVSFNAILIPVLDISAWMTCLLFKLNLPQPTPNILLFFPNQPIPARFPYLHGVSLSKLLNGKIFESSFFLPYLSCFLSIHAKSSWLFLLFKINNILIL